MRKNTICRIFRAAGGLFICAIGLYLTILADVGLAPWDALCMGISYHLPVRYGTASVMVSLCVLVMDLLLREPVGVGTVLDALGVGKAVDLLQWLDVIPHPQGLVQSIVWLIAGMLVISVGQWIYMAAAMGCGPRDSLLVGLGKRVRRVPIGCVTMAVFAAVVLVSWALRGPIGIGTVLCVALQGPCMQAVFRAVRFEPRNITHESLLSTVGHLADR
ncbi:MAG: hypothetical protein KBS74_04380 [Clostridiales bacterium]|nr:hypothetical protein [Candidatus Cacconaster stercorequi]